MRGQAVATNIRNFDELLAATKERGPSRLALAAADDKTALKALLEAQKQGIAEAKLFGDEERTHATLNRLATGDFPAIEHAPEEAVAAEKAILSVKTEESDILLKDRLKSASLLKCVLIAQTKGDALEIS